MAYDTITSVVDDVTNNLALYSNEKKTAIDKVMSSVAYANYGTATTSSGTVTLTDSSFPVQAITCGTTNVVLRLPAVGTTNHPFFIINAGTAYTVQVQNAGSVNVGPVIPITTYRPYASSGTAWFANDGMSVVAGADGNVLTAASGVWTSAAPAAGGKIAGDVVQIVNTQTGAAANGAVVIPSDDTIPQNTEGTEFMTLAVTPTNASNILYIDVILCLSISIAHYVIAALFQDATAGALAASIDQVPAGGDMTEVIFRHKMTAGTVSATTFKVRAGPGSAGTIYFNGDSGGRKLGGVIASSITITEIKV